MEDGPFTFSEHELFYSYDDEYDGPEPPDEDGEEMLSFDEAWARASSQ